MGQNITEKILARASGRTRVKPGDIVDAHIDRLMVNDFVGPSVLYEFERSGAQRVVISDRVKWCVDHNIPPDSIQSANNMIAFRNFCAEHQIRDFCDIGFNGIAHQLMIEDCVNPGELAVGTDTHSTMYGGLGAFSCGISATDATIALSNGSIWLRVPNMIRIELTGSLQGRATGKDAALCLINKLCARNFCYVSLEIGGEGVHSLSMDSRFTIANMLAELDAKNIIFEADELTQSYMGKPIELLRPDADAQYLDTCFLNLEEVEPMVALPHSNMHAEPVRTVESVHADQVFIGSCTNGRLEDIEQAVRVLCGKRVKRGTRLIVVPASQKVMLEATKRGYIATLVEAGALILPPNCAACSSSGPGRIGDGEVCVSTTNRNFKGRMGSKESFVYLTSAYTAAVTALNGYLSTEVVD